MMNKFKKCIAVVAACTLLVLIAGCAGLQERIAGTREEEITQLHLYGNMTEMQDKKDVRNIAAVFTQKGEQKLYHAAIKIQGSSSLSYDKKNYTIQFFDDAAHETESAIDLGWGTANEYCLKANWVDKTHSRNVVTAKLATEVQKKYALLEQSPRNGVIDGFPIEVYMNDAFHGIYTWNIPKAGWMFGMDENNPNHIVMCGENWEKSTVFYDEALPSSWSVEAGPDNEETFEKFVRLSDFIRNSTDEEFKDHFNEYLNLDAVLNYYVMVEFAHLPDNCGKNMLFATYDGLVWYPSLYDLDTSWGTSWDGKELYESGHIVTFAERSNLARRVEAAFPQELRDRYFALRKDILTKEHVFEMFTAFDARIPSQWKAREVEKWGEEIPGFDLSQIEDYLDTNISLLDQKFESLVQ